MADRIGEVRARAIAAREGNPVHIGCCGWVENTHAMRPSYTLRCKRCRYRVPESEVAFPADGKRQYAADVTHLLALVDELRERNDIDEQAVERAEHAESVATDLAAERDELRERAEKAEAGVRSMRSSILNLHTYDEYHTFAGSSMERQEGDNKPWGNWLKVDDVEKAIGVDFGIDTMGSKR